MAERFENALELWISGKPSLMQQAIDLLNHESTSNDLRAIKTLGMWFYEMDKLKPFLIFSINDACKKWKIAADWGDLDSIMALAQVYLESDPSMSIKYLKLGAEMGDSRAAQMLSKHYRSTFDENAPSDEDDECQDEKVQKACIQAAKIGCTDSMKWLAEKDETNRFAWYMKAASQGDQSALAKIAYMLYHGISIEKNVPLALEYFIQASRLSDTPSLLVIASHYVQGIEGERDIARGFELLCEASSNGDLKACKLCADLLWIGDGCEKDQDKAMELYKKASDNGFIEAMPSLARCYYEKKDVAKARDLIKNYLLKLCESDPEMGDKRFDFDDQELQVLFSE